MKKNNAYILANTTDTNQKIQKKKKKKNPQKSKTQIWKDTKSEVLTQLTWRKCEKIGDFHNLWRDGEAASVILKYIGNDDNKNGCNNGSNNGDGW